MLPMRLAEASDQLLQIQRLHLGLLHQVPLRCDADYPWRPILTLAGVQQLDLLDPAQLLLEFLHA